MFLIIVLLVFMVGWRVNGIEINSGTPMNNLLGMMLKERQCQDFWFDNDYDYTPHNGRCGNRACRYPDEICMIKTFSSVDSNGIRDSDDYKCKQISRNCMSMLKGTGGGGSIGIPATTPAPQPTFRPRPTTTQRPDSFGGNRCSLPPVRGRCRAYKRMYYHKDGQCLVFYYGGCGGNENRFQTKQHCTDACITGQSGSGGRATTAPPRPPQPTRPPPASNNDCSSPADQGAFCPGRRGGWKRPWAYSNGQCTQFWYRGCRGNANRYETKQACLQSCSSSRPRPPPTTPRPQPPAPSGPAKDCTSAADQGAFCRGRRGGWKRPWAYSNGECSQFWYRGCRGNANRYETKEDCIRSCASSGRSTPRPSRPSPSGQRPAGDQCAGSQRELRGNGSRYQVRWYYDTRQRRCKRFWWSGSGGKPGNRFSDQRSCERTCLP